MQQVDQTRIAFRCPKAALPGKMSGRRINDLAARKGFQLRFERLQFRGDFRKPGLRFRCPQRFRDGVTLFLKRLQFGERFRVFDLLEKDAVDEVGASPARARLDAVLRGNRGVAGKVLSVLRPDLQLGQRENVVVFALPKFCRRDPDEAEWAAVPVQLDRLSFRIRLIGSSCVGQHAHFTAKFGIVGNLDAIANREPEPRANPAKFVKGRNQFYTSRSPLPAQVDLHPLFHILLLCDLAVITVLRLLFAPGSEFLTQFCNAAVEARGLRRHFAIDLRVQLLLFGLESVDTSYHLLPALLLLG